MGLFAFLCCCAAADDNDYPIEKDNFHSFTRVGVCNEQPEFLRAPPGASIIHSRPGYAGDYPTNVFYHEPHQRPSVSDRPPSLKPLDFGESSLLVRWPRHDKRKSSSGHGQRPSISAPHSFRRLDHNEAQTQSLVPLRLGPVILRESPTPEIQSPTTRLALNTTAHHRSDSTQQLLPDITRPEPTYHAQRETPFERCVQRSADMWPLSAHAGPVEQGQPNQSMEIERSLRPSMSRESSSSSLRQAGGETTSSSMSSRHSSERLRPKRKRSQQSIRRTYNEHGEHDVDKEILELNTIVEERRADSTRVETPEHVPAVAPRMQVRARSETLEQIGSALSRPHTARVSTDSGFAPVRPTRPSISTTRRTSSRVSGWLSNIFPTASTSHLPSTEPFYKLQPAPQQLRRTQSTASICTSVSVTEMDSPSLTVASSPISKGHSRSHTGESWLTPITPATLHGGHHDPEGKGEEPQWPIDMTTTRHSQVGLAL